MARSEKTIAFSMGNRLMITSFAAPELNKISDMFVECGWTALGVDLTPDAAGVFVATGTTEPGVQFQTAPFVTFNNAYITYNIFKHPTKEFYIRVNYLKLGTGGTNGQALGYSLTFGKSLSSLISHTGINIYKNSLYNPQSCSCSLTTQVPIFMYSDDNTFWIHSGGHTKSSAPSSITPSSSFVPPFPNSMLSVLVSFKNDDVIVTSPPFINNFGSTVMSLETIQSRIVSGKYCGIRSSVYSNQFDAWSEEYDCYIDYVGQPDIQLNDGVRYKQANAIMNGNREYFDYYHMAMSAVNDLSNVVLNINGNERTYKACFSMGTSSPMTTNDDKSLQSGLLLPWE